MHRHVVKTDRGDYDLTSYATSPSHEDLVNQVFASVLRKTWRGYLDWRGRVDRIPITAKMVEEAADEFDVSPDLMVAVMQVDSGLGVRGLGARTHNPGNVGNTDDGSMKDWGTWEAGVRAVARNLSKRRVVEGEPYHGI